MKRIVIFIVSSIVLTPLLKAQDRAADSSYIISLNQQIDKYVMQQNVVALDTLYAGDFVFSHGTGLIEGKESWLAVVAKNNYPSRKHDSVTAEMHPGLAIARGKMSIERIDMDKTARYTLQYIRVYAYRNNRWQMISHITTYEQHEQ